MAKTKIERSMYSYKVAWLAGADPRSLKSKLQSEASFAAKPQNKEWYGNKGKTVRNLCLMRNLMIQKYKAFKAFNSFEKPLDKELHEYAVKSRLDPILEELSQELIDEMSERYKRPFGCIEIVNFISLWMHDNCSEILKELGIPYPEEISKRLFIYPGFNSENQIMNFSELRLTSDYSSSLEALIPIGVVNRTTKKTLFLGDRNFYSIILNLEPDEVKLPEKASIKWYSDERYILDDAAKDTKQPVDTPTSTPVVTTEESIQIPIHQEPLHQEPLHQENDLEPPPQKTSQVPNLIIPEESGLNKTAFAGVPYIDVGIELDQPKISTYCKAISKVNFDGPTGLFPKNLIDKSDRVVLVIDCDNVNFFKTVLAVNDILKDYTVKQIQLHLDQHSLYIWNMFDNMVKTTVPIIKRTTCRIKGEKSSVDVAVTTGICESVYKFGCNCVVLFSSDSDFLALIDSINKTKSKDDSVKWAICYESHSTNGRYLEILSDRKVEQVNIDTYMPDDKLHTNVISSVINYTVGKVLLKKTVGEWFLESTFKCLVTYIISVRNRYCIGNMSDRLIYYLVEEAVAHLNLDLKNKMFNVNNMYFELQ